MSKRSGNKGNNKQSNSIKICDSKTLSIVDDNVLQALDIKECNIDERMTKRIGLIKSESAPLLIDHKGYEFIGNALEKLDVTIDKVSRVSKKKEVKVIEDSEEARECSAIRLSHFVIVDSVLRETNINPNIEAQLPVQLNLIYQKFINSKKYIENFQAKDEFYRGVSLLGVGVEDRIYNKRKALEESLKRGFRLRPNPKPRRQFYGTIINRPLKNRNKLNYSRDNDDKVKYNLFTIGSDLLNKNHRLPLRKTIKKKSVMRRAAAQKLELAKKALNEACASSDDENIDKPTKGIALSRTKRQPKVPQLDFKYCYSEGFGVRNRRHVDSCKEDQFMEIEDSDSSSVIEVFPPGDKENAEYSDECVGARRPTNPVFSSSKCLIGPRKAWRQENKALNLLDKLRLGLQCTVIQTERDIIIQNLTLEDLSTLRSRLQGLATFKNIEAEYDKNGQETARATIDRRVLNLPFKGYESQIDPRLSCNVNKKGEETLKRKMVPTSIDKKRQLTPVKDLSSANVKMEDYCSTWVRPKVRSVKKIRKLYTQSASTPNILARSQAQNRPDNSSQGPNRSSSASTTDGNNSSQHGTSAPVSFYPQITSVSSNIISETLIDMKPIKSEQFIPNAIVTEPCTSSLSSLSTIEPSNSSPVVSLSRSAITTNSTISGGGGGIGGIQSLQDGTKKVTTISGISQSVSGTPATAMSASQLLMLRKGGGGGGGQNMSESGTSFSSTISMSGNDQLFTNQILKPFKKIIPSSSPAKLEIDEEETEFELTPSIIAQAKAFDSHGNPNCSPVKVPFLSKPLIQPAGILANCRTIHLSNNSRFQAHNSIPISTPLPSNLLFTCSKLPIIEASALNAIISVPTASNTDPALNAALNVTNNESNATVLNSPPNPKIRHRKFTHNFLTSNSINFREVLCSIAPKTVPLTRVPLPVSLNASSSSIGHSSTPCQPIAPKLLPTITGSLPLSPVSYKPISVPAKGSSVVLKSLLVGSNSTNDLCHLNKAAAWSSKYMATNASNQDSKIKWQVGGSVVSSQPSLAGPTVVSKENKLLDIVATNPDSK